MPEGFPARPSNAKRITALVRRLGAIDYGIWTRYLTHADAFLECELTCNQLGGSRQRQAPQNRPPPLGRLIYGELQLLM
jgi:hypothetical protein